MGSAVPDKVLAPLKAKPVILHSIEAFLESAAVNHICLVYRDEPQRWAIQSALTRLDTGAVAISWTQGGPTRQASVLNGLESLPPETRLVFIHDGARPLLRAATIVQLGEQANREGAACLAHRVVDTIKRRPPGEATDRLHLEDLDRNRLWAMETPQVFQREAILQAYRQIEQTGAKVTDDAAAVNACGGIVSLLNNPHPNPKITTPADLAYAEWLLNS